MSSPFSFWTIYKFPAVLAVISVAALISGLLADGVWDVLCWVGMSIPIVVMAVYIFGQRQQSHNGSK